MNKTNYHTHHYLCTHADGNVIDYVEEAIKRGYKEIGISDHGPLPITPPFRRMTYDEFEDIYLKEIDIAKDKYKEQISIKSSLEIEYIYNYDEYYKKLLSKLDYLSLAVHYHNGYGEFINKGVFTIKTKEALIEYAKLAVDSLNTGFFKIIVHPDAFMYSYPIFDDVAKECSIKIIEAAKKNNVLLEFNANGIRNGKREYADGSIDYGYPNYKFWQLVKEYDAKVIVGSDCHSPKKLDDTEMNTARSLANKYGLNVVEFLK